MQLLDLIQQKRSEKKTLESCDRKFDRWTSCKKCQSFLDKDFFSAANLVCPKCDHHHRMSAHERITLLLDENTFMEKYVHLSAKDPLNFFDTKSYKERVEQSQKATSLKDAVVTGTGKIGGKNVAIAAMDFRFIGGSLGSVVGEKLTRLIEEAIIDRLPCVIVSSSGGARMQESIFSLMQMAKVSQAIQRFQERGLFYLSVLTDPTMGGVTASFASLGDVIIAEPKAMIGFAGARVIEQTIKQKLPDDAQTAEFQLKNGLIDAIVHRKDLKNKIVSLLQHFLG